MIAGCKSESELHIIAAGSLLEFAMKEIPSYGVGRIRSLYMYPFSFDEFLLALNEGKLLEYKQNASYEKPLPDIFHNKIVDYLKKFLLMGGMPEVVSKYIRRARVDEINNVLNDLIISLQSDFSKYKVRRINPPSNSQLRIV